MTGIIDLHSDTILHCYLEKKHLRDFPGHINTDKLRSGGSMCQALALFIDTDGKTAVDGQEPWQLYKSMLSYWNAEVDLNSDALRPAYTTEEIKENASKGFISTLLTVEDGIGIDGRHERLDEMYSDGVRMLALTWNYENCIGFPNSPDPELHKKGLKPFGRELVEHMNSLGMLVDVSHLSEGGFYEVAELSQVPFLASHSCARALRDHQRNLTDEQLKKLADRGGVVGLNFGSRFLSEDIYNTHAEDIVRHMVHIKNVAGADTPAWGSDFDGVRSVFDFKDYTGFPQLISLMSKEFTDDELDKICSGNFLRMAKDAGMGRT